MKKNHMFLKWISCLCSLALVIGGCSASSNPSDGSEEAVEESGTAYTQLYELDSEEFSRVLADQLVAELESEGDDVQIKVEEFNTLFMSKEYIEELEYNSKENIYFGYTLGDVLDMFEDTPFVFTMDASGKTVVVEEVPYRDIGKEVFTNVAIGSGILCCLITLQYCPFGGIPQVIRMVVSFSLEKAIEYGAYSLILSSIKSVIHGFVNGEDLQTIMENLALNGSKGFKMGVIVGTVVGAAKGGLSYGYRSYLLNSSTGSQIGALSEEDMAKMFRGCSLQEQVIYSGGEVVASKLLGSTIPDGVYTIDGTTYAVEMKNYDLEKYTPQLVYTLKQQLANRIDQMPDGAIQKIVLNVAGRGYTLDFINEKIEEIQNALGSLGDLVNINYYDGTNASDFVCS